MKCHRKFVAMASIRATDRISRALANGPMK